MDVLFLRPWFDVYGKFRMGKKVTKMPPLGFMYLAAVLEQDGHNVSILDADAKEMGDWMSVLKNRRPQVVGLTATTPEIMNAGRVADEIKREIPDTIVILGGAHASALPEETLSAFGSVDYVIVGEGEETVRELISALETGSSLGEIQGIALRKDGKPCCNPLRGVIMDLDSLPVPARHLIDPEDYLLPVAERGLVRSTLVQTSRGCPYRCIFCYNSLHPSPFRSRSPASVLRELEILSDSDIEAVVFCDDTFTFSKKRVMEICDGIIEKNMDIKWYCLARADTIDREIVEKMKASGLIEISIGVETGNQAQLDRIGKKTTLDHYRRAFAVLDEVDGIETRGSFILGLPHDTPSTIRETIDFALSLPVKAAFFNIATPYPGCEMEEMASRGDGMKTLVKNWQDYQRWGQAVVEVGGMGPDELISWQKLAMMKFYTRPRIVIHHMKYFVRARQFPLGYMPRPLSFLYSSMRGAVSLERKE